MRLLFFLLLFINVAVFAYVYSGEHRAGAEAERAQLQINPERVKIMKAGEGESPKPSASLGSPSRLVCLEWGSFDAEELPRAQAALAKFELGDKVVTADRAASHWVYIASFKRKADAEKKAGELKAIGITDVAIVQESTRPGFAISLGVFKSEEAANGRLAELKLKGVRSVAAGPREGGKILVIRDPGDTVVARLAELKADFPNAELKPASCAVNPGTRDSGLGTRTVE